MSPGNLRSNDRADGVQTETSISAKDMIPFRKDVTCPKCTGTEYSFKHQPKGKEQDEHLFIICNFCGYQVRMRCSDYKE